MEFIDVFYRPGHILSTSRELFDWQYENVADGCYDIAVAVDTASSNILGILGFVDSRRYDAALSHDNCLWLALWQVKPDAGLPTLGPALLAFVRRHVEHTILAVSGVRATAAPLYRAMGFAIDECRHYYMLNPDVARYHIGIIPASVPRAAAEPPARAVQLQILTRDDFVHDAAVDAFHAARVPRKSARYFYNRYVCHPFYGYTVLLVRREGLPIGLLATRIATQGGRHVMRIVDMILDPADVPGIAWPLQRLLRNTECEYADLVQFGMGDACLRLAGFTEVDADAGVVIPNLFEPFVRENRRVTLCYRGSAGNRPAGFIAFKGDGDQDRPNALNVTEGRFARA